MPRVCAVIPVKNGELTIEDAVRSVMLQTFRDFELIVVDDGSTDRTVSIVEKLAEADSRVRLLKNPKRGRTLARNHGISQLDSEYVAIMDADDICLPHRFNVQTEQMESDHKLSVIGSQIIWFGERTGMPTMLLSKEECRKGLELFSPLCHPTAFMRRKAFDACGRYAEGNQLAEDYDIFCRLSYFGDIMNIEQPLLMYRLHATQSSQSQKDMQTNHMWNTVLMHHKNLLGKDAVSNASMTKRLIYAAMALGPKHARQSARALRDCLKAMHELNKKRRAS